MKRRTVGENVQRILRSSIERQEKKFASRAMEK